TDLQLALFPLAFWAMANDLYTLAQTRRLFPILATGGALGSIAGNVLAAVLSSILPMDGGNAPQVLGLGVVIFLGGFVVLQVALRNYDVRARQSRQVESMAQTLKGGMDVVRNVPMFRFLALAMILAGLSLTVIEFHFLYTLDLAAQELDDPAAYFQTFFGLYKAVMIASILAFQSFITSRYLDKLGISNSFLMLPIGLLLGAVLVMVASTVFAPGLLGVAAGRLIARMVQKGWDEPARKSAQGLIPDERRGRVATIMDNYFYATATIIGSLLVGALLILTGQDVLSRQITTDIYLGIAVVCALGAIYAAYKLRGVYDQSLLNWRLSRSRRKSVLDGLDFDDVRSAEEKAEDTQRRRTVLDGMTFDKLGTITPPPIPAKDIPHPSPEINEEPNAPAEATDTPTDASDTPQRRRRSAGASPLDNLSFDDDDDDTSAEQRAETKRKRKSILDDLNLDDL
ncbi:MAG: Npt1/Npt2 family nucleotide transporter, partial [Anaerolineales bacterium]